jgi:SAM-dependent methyltransferase
MMTESKSTKIDLGCGKRKQEGFIGVDRFPMPEVDILADIDQRLPLEDDSVDVLFSSHSLEHVKDLMFTMREIYRVCKHGAQVCIVAPYNEQKLNIANPYHITVFNEHTPRFWTDHTETPVDPEDYLDPVERPWGLSRSDNSNPGLDIRLVSMEFFYFPEYQFLPIEQKRRFRNERFNVCEQIMFQLIVWKGDEHSGENYSEHVRNFTPYEPNHIRHLKMREQEAIIQKFNQTETELRKQVEDLKTQLADQEIAATSGSVQPAVSIASDVVGMQYRRISELTEDRAQAERNIHVARTESHQLRLQIMSLFEKSESLNLQLRDANILLMQSRMQNEHSETRILQLVEQNKQLAEQKQKHSDEVQRINEQKLQLIDQKQELIEQNLHIANEFSASILSLTKENQELRNQLESVATIKAKYVLAKAELDAANGLIQWHRANEHWWSNEKNRLNQDLLNVQQAAQSQSPLVSSLNHALSTEQQNARQARDEALKVIDNLHAENSAFRSSRSLHLISQYRSKDSLWHMVSPAFSSLKTYSKENFLGKSNPSLILGKDLRTTPYREYIMPVAQNQLSAISLAVRPLMRGTNGIIGVEIVSNDKEVVSQAVLPLSDINPDQPTQFALPAPITLNKNWYLRIFVKESDVPVSLYEVCEYSIMKNRTKYSPFAFLQ